MVLSQRLGTVRFFFAFILLGVCLFWKSAMFSSTESAAEMLFSLMSLGWDGAPGGISLSALEEGDFIGARFGVRFGEIEDSF